MNKAIVLELRFFGISILWGSLIIIFYDCLRITRELISHKRIIVALEDIIYWILCGLIIFKMMYKHNNGIIRAFSILGMFIGMLFYHYLLSDFLVEKISSLIKTILKRISWALSYILKPFKWLKKSINKTIGKVIKEFLVKLKKHLHNTRKLLKNKNKSSKISVSGIEDGDLLDEDKTKKKN